MLVASAALAAILLGAYFLAPVAQVRYHVWRYKSGRDVKGESLKWLADWTARHKMDRSSIESLLGKDVGGRTDRLEYYIVFPPTHGVLPTGYVILFENGRASEVRPFPGMQ